MQTGNATAGPSKKGRNERGESADSENLDDDEPGYFEEYRPVRASGVMSMTVANRTSNDAALKAIGEFMNCGECTKRFTVVSRLDEKSRTESR
jgi:hypothetical protein